MKFSKLLMSLIAIIAAVTLVGCTNEGKSEYGSEEVTLTYSIWDKIQEPGMRAIADVFEAQNPGIKINVEVTPWDQYWTKLEAAATGGVMPDVFWMHPSQIVRYGEAEMLMDLTNKISESEVVDLNKFPKDLVELYTVNEKRYGVIKDFDTVGLWYNKTLFDEAGLEYPNEAWTWNDLLEAAKVLTNEEEGVYGFAAPLGMHEGIYNFIYQNGGDVLLDNNTKSGYTLEKTREAIQWYVDLSLKEKVSPTHDQFVDTSAVLYFQSGKTAMSLHGSWMTAEFMNNEYTSQNCDVAVLPQGPAGRATIYNGLANSVSTFTEYPEESWTFVEFLGSKEAQEIQAREGSAISAYEGTAPLFADANQTFNVGVFIDMLEYATIRPYTKNSALWENLEFDIFRKVFSGELSVDEATNQLAEEINVILSNN